MIDDEQDVADAWPTSEGHIRAGAFAAGRRGVLTSAPSATDDECPWCTEIGDVCVWHAATAEGARAFAEAVCAAAGDPNVEHAVRALQQTHRTGRPLLVSQPPQAVPATPTGEQASLRPLSHLGAVLAEVAQERLAQNDRWGEQNHPDGTGGSGYVYAAGALRQRCEDAFAQGRGTWLHILAEEVGEAFAEADADRLRVELVQVAAVAVAWSQAIDRRIATDPTR